MNALIWMTLFSMRGLCEPKANGRAPSRLSGCPRLALEDIIERILQLTFGEYCERQGDIPHVSRMEARAERCGVLQNRRGDLPTSIGGTQYPSL